MKITTFNNQTINLNINYPNGNLIALPALIDPHVHFRTPGHEYKENWKTGAKAAIAGGVTTVFDMPNTTPSTVSTSALQHKKEIIDAQLNEAEIPLHYKLWFGATPDNLIGIEKIGRLSTRDGSALGGKDYKDYVIGIKVFMGSSTGDLLVDKKKDQAQIFKLAHELNLPVAVHAESEANIQYSRFKIKNPHVHDHSKIRRREAAIEAVTQAIELADTYHAKLYILHTSTKEEMELIKQAKKDNISVFAEVTPHHLFLTEDDYNILGTKAQMNPPLRTLEDQDALWDGILDGVIDTRYRSKLLLPKP